ncbi:unnamed protein product [Peniophora sp. CBMAI 1063]|nr:unnamed protein product [Peniophora sp. CBMAI 1063]
MDLHTLDVKHEQIGDWDEGDVQTFFTHLGLPQYEPQIREHGISGDALCLMGPDELKEFGVASVGQRLQILKAVYQLKLLHNVTIDQDAYVPPSESDGRESLTIDRLYDLLRDQDQRLRSLESDHRRLSDSVHGALDDLQSIRSSTVSTAASSTHTAVDSPVTRTGAFQWAKVKNGNGSSDVESPHPSPQRAEHTASSSSTPTSNISQGTAQAQATPTPTTTSSANGSRNGPPRPTRQESSDNLKSFKVSLEDPAWKVLPAALRKYKINNDDWQNYAMFICYGPPNNRIERCLSYDEKPLLLFQKLKDASKNPVFMLKHIKDIRSPIAVAQQKQAARKASNASTTNPNTSTTSTSSTSRTGAQGHGRTLSRPPRLQVHAAQASTEPPLNTGGSAATGWPELMSPAGGDSRPGLHTSASNSNLSINESAPKSAVAPVTASSAGGDGHGRDGGHGGKEREQPVGGENVSYSVAIYPYMAEQEDEFDVVVGDTFVIISRARGWWVVQRDPQGTGTVDSDPSKQGWVPAGCLLETRIPIARAIASTSSNPSSNPGSTPSSPTNGVAGGINARTPILPLHIVSTSFPGYALMDYKKKGDEELDLSKDDALRVFKRYNHWSYAVKEDGGERGWVPSWYIGKVAASAQTPATPAIADSRDKSGILGGSGGANITLDSEAGFDRSAGPGVGGMPAVSPMSSAFPPQQSVSRTSTYL